VHGTELENVHFHEVGAIDSIVDIVGCAIGFRYLGVEAFYCRPIHLGGGTITFSHGTWPVPAPATAELTKGFPVSLGGVEAELATPTGAAVIATTVDPEAEMPVFRVLGVGLGAGDRQIPGIPNVLRLLLGETGKPVESVSTAAGAETVCSLEANIDDLDGEALGRFLEVAMAEGALDVTFAPLVMKKSRPGQLLSVLCRPEDRDRFVDLIFRETTTLGLRECELRRWCLDRESIQLESPWGTIACKVSRYRERVLDISPEHEDLKRIADSSGMTLREVRRAVSGLIADKGLWERHSI